MDEPVSLEELRAVVPPPPEQRLAPTRLDALRETLLQDLAGSARPRRRPCRRRALALLLVPAALAAAALAYSLTANRSAEQLGNEVTCFQKASLDSGAARAPFSGQDLASFCSAQWTSGSIASPPAGPPPARWVACEGDKSGVDVFPSGDQDLCRRLGLNPVPASYYEAVARYSALESDLGGQFPEQGCVSAQSATTTTRRLLDSHGYTDWTVRRTGFGDLTPCALLPDLDPVNGVATIRGGVRPELVAAAVKGLERASYCGPESALLADVREALGAAGFGDWSVRVDHPLTERWPCVAGLNDVPAEKTIVLVGYASR